MTVCIGIICPKLKKIVMVTDELISDLAGAISVEGVRKHAFLNTAAPWVASYAGWPTNAIPLVRRIRTGIYTAQGANGTQAALGRTALSGDEIIDICRKAYDSELLRIHESEILQPFGFKTVGIR